jgi:hypothetical protein
VPAHTEGHEGNLLVRTRIRSLRMLAPLDGALDAPAAGTLCVTSSLVLVALGGSDLASGFRLRTLSFVIPHGNCETCF